MSVSPVRDSCLYLCLVWTPNPPRPLSPAVPGSSLAGRSAGASRDVLAVGDQPPPRHLAKPQRGPRDPSPPGTRAPGEHSHPTGMWGSMCCGAVSPSQRGCPASQPTSCLLSQPNSSFRIINSAAQEKSSAWPGPVCLHIAELERGRGKVCTSAGGEGRTVRGITCGWRAGTAPWWL